MGVDRSGRVTNVRPLRSKGYGSGGSLRALRVPGATVGLGHNATEQHSASSDRGEHFLESWGQALPDKLAGGRRVRGGRSRAQCQ